MEAAEHEMLRSVGIAILPDHDASPDAVTWPRVSASCDYFAAARFEDWLEIDVAIEAIGSSSVTFRVRFTRLETDGKAVAIAEGKTVSVCCRLLPGGGLEKVAIPEAIRDKLQSLRPE
jgi:acyl-CoA thioesterase FadM